MDNLEPNTRIFYFATRYRDFIKSIQTRAKAYSKLDNCGVANVNSEGVANIYLDCPQLYLNDDGKVYHRHLHYLYWNKEDKMWDNKLYTKKLFVM